MKRIILLCTTVLACLTGWAQETECRPMLAGNPVWVYQQHNFLVDMENTPDNPEYYELAYHEAERSFVYVFLYGTEERNGYQYQVAWQIDSRNIRDVINTDIMHKTVLVREEDGRVFSPREEYYIYVEEVLGCGNHIVYDIQGDETVTNNYRVEAGDKYDETRTCVVKATGTLQCPDGKARKTWTWTWEGDEIIVEQIGRITEQNYPMPFGPYLMPPIWDYPISDDLYSCVLNSVYSDGVMIYKAPIEYGPTWIWGTLENYAVCPYINNYIESRIYHEPPHLQQVLDFIATLPADAIITPSADKRQETPIYDLQGRRLSSKPQKGMYIQGGKKIVNK